MGIINPLPKSVETTNLAEEAVTTPKIAANAVTSAKIEAGLLSGVWTALEGLSAKLEPAAGLQTIRVRTLNAAVAELRGGIRAKVAEPLPAGTTIATLPVGFRPPAEVNITVLNTKTGAASVLKITAAGVMTLKDELVAEAGIDFDGLTFNLT